MDNKKFLITDYLKGKEAFGESEAVKVEAIAKALEMSEDEVREKVRQERIDGMIICCGGKYEGDYGRPVWRDDEGKKYFLPVGADEVTAERAVLEIGLLKECRYDERPEESTLDEVRTFWDAEDYIYSRIEDSNLTDEVYIHFHVGEA